MTIGPCMRCDVCGRVEVDLTPVLDLVASPENREEFYAGWSMSIGEEVLDDDNGHWLFGEPPGQACDYCVDLLHGDGDNRQISPMWVPIHPGDVAREVIGIGMFTTKTKAAA